MSNQIHIIQNAITTTISEIFRGDFRRICEVKKAVLHLEAIYFCHGTCYLLKRENMPIKDQLALYQRIELIPQSTTEFFENNRECIINNSFTSLTKPHKGNSPAFAGLFSCTSVHYRKSIHTHHLLSSECNSNHNHR